MGTPRLNWVLARCLVSLRRIAAALDRAYPPPAAPRRRAPVDFGTATTELLDAAYDSRNAEATK